MSLGIQDDFSTYCEYKLSFSKGFVGFASLPYKTISEHKGTNWIPAMSRPRISVITPTLNQASFLKQTLHSVLGQKGDFTLEYMVCDGGSTDGTLEILKEHKGQVRWISEKDTGPADAVNRGLSLVGGDIVGWINSDDLLCEGALQRVAERFRGDPGMEWLHGRCEIVDAHGLPCKKWISRYKDRCACRYTYDRLLTENFISQMTVFWRREVLLEIGNLDARYNYAYDYDLWLRLARRKPPGYIRENQACFRWYAASRGRANFGAQIQEDWRIAMKFAQGNSLNLWCKAFKSSRTYAIYSLLNLVERGPSTPKPSSKAAKKQA